MREKTIATNSKLANVKRFVKKFGPSACLAEDKTALPAEAVLAQAALETGWGCHILKGRDPNTSKTVASNNLFNIKARGDWRGSIVVKKVHEFSRETGEKYWTTDAFRRYATFQESFEDYGHLILSLPRYTAAVRAVDDPEEYLRQIQACGYATDSSYAEKCIKIMRKYFNVTVIDEPDLPQSIGLPEMEKTGWMLFIDRLVRSLKKLLGKKG